MIILEKEDAVEKIKKLLEKANKEKNDSQAEIEAAALMAQRLMAKYDVNIDEIDLKEIHEIVHGELDIRKYRSWKFSLAHLIGDNFRCEHYFSGGYKWLRFMGHSSDVAIANEMFVFLYKIGNRNALRLERQVRKQAGSAIGVYQSYVQGFVQGLKEKLDEQCRALMLVIPDDVKLAYEEKRKGFAKNKRSVFTRYAETLIHEAYIKGQYDGKYALYRTELNDEQRKIEEVGVV